ncbi:MAG: DinB family protein [Pseudomonadota bacterium]
MTTLVDHFRAMARNSLWANDRLFEACTKLPDGAFTAERTGFFPSISATLNHNHAVDLYYRDALEGGGKGRTLYNDTPVMDDPAVSKDAQRRSDEALVGVCDRLSADDLDRFVPMDRCERGIIEERIDAVLAHLFQHQIHHRGQAHCMLSATPVAPPQLDDFFLTLDREPHAMPLAAEVGLP